MLSLLSHRGPNEYGIYRNSQALLASARLSIIDLKSGQQPLKSENDQYWIVFNGEIFNYEELRKELINKHQCIFRTHSDTEVLVNLYQYYGPSSLEKLDGQFAVAIWDRNLRRLFLARDRLGICPLHYYVDEDHFVFGSEIKGIFSLPFVRRNFRRDSLLDIGAFWTTIPPKTHFEGIFELPPGHTLLFENGKISVKQYWDFPSEGGETVLSLSEALNVTTKTLESSVKKRMKADVEVGTYLSGGLDSSIITLLARQHSHRKIKTFSITFDEDRYDERDFQDILIRKLETDHTSVHCGKGMIQENFLKAIWHAEKILFRTAAVPMMLLSKEVNRKGIKVVLTGEGADEIFLGYDLFKEAKLLEFWARDTASAIRPLLLKKLYPYLPQFDEKYFSFQKAFYRKILTSTSIFPFKSHRTRWETSQSLYNYLDGGVGSPEKLRDFFEEIQGRYLISAKTPLLRQAQRIEVQTLLNGYLLSSQGDRMSMANGVELRPPFLSHLLIEEVARIPVSLKLPGFNEKYLLKKAYKDKLPLEQVRRPKQPYLSPDAHSFSFECDYIQELFSKANLKRYEYLSHERILKLVNKCLSPHNNTLSFRDNFCFMSLLSLLALNDCFLDNFNRQITRNDLPNLKIVDERP